MPVYPKMLAGKQRKDKQGRPVWRLAVWLKGEKKEKLFAGPKRDAEAEEARMKLEARSPQPEPQPSPPKSDELTFSAFCLGKYAEHAKAHLAKSTWAIRRHKLAALGAVFDDVLLSEITTEHVERYKAMRVAKGRGASTINGELAALATALQYARDLGIPCGTPRFKHLPLRGKGRVKFWTPEQIRMLYDACERVHPALLDIITAIVNTGMREGEAVVSEKAWVDLQRGLLTIQPNEYWQPKNGRPREIPISDGLRPRLEWAMKQPGRYLFTAERKSMGRTEHTRWAHWPKKQFARVVEAAGLKGGAHTLRHSYAAGVLAGGGDLYLLQQLLGHASIKTTQIYAHLLPSHLEQARNLVNLAPSSGPATVEARRRWKKTGARTGARTGTGDR